MTEEDMMGIKETYRYFVRSREKGKHTEYSFALPRRGAEAVLEYIPVDDVGIMPVSIKGLKSMVESLGDGEILSVQFIDTEA